MVLGQDVPDVPDSSRNHPGRLARNGLQFNARALANRQSHLSATAWTHA